MTDQQNQSAPLIGHNCNTATTTRQQYASTSLIGQQCSTHLLAEQGYSSSVLKDENYGSTDMIGEQRDSLALIEQPLGSSSRFDPRRNSAPPSQNLTAKQVLAFLPRTHPRKMRCATSLKKMDVKASPVTTLNSNTIPTSSQTTISLQAAPPSFPNILNVPNPPAILDLSSPKVIQVQRRPSNDPSTPLETPTPTSSKVPEELGRALRKLRGRHLKRFNTHWQASMLRTDRNTRRKHSNTTRADCNATGQIHRKPHSKLLGDDSIVSIVARPQSRQQQRYIEKDGKCRVNLGPIQDKSRFLWDIFTTLVDLRYRWFLVVFTACYVSTWLVFGLLYFLSAWLRGDLAAVAALGAGWRGGCLEGVDGFLSALLLSVETQRTVGYGGRQVSARCTEGALLLMAQSLLGSAIDALMVGCMFVKVSRPQQRAQTLVFSHHCVVSERDGRLCLLFRIGDLRESHMVDAKIRAKLIKSRQTLEGEFLPLEQSEINLGYDTGGDRLLLVEPQTITHVITDSSPFWDVSAESLRRECFEIIVILEGIVETSGMTCQARTSYTEQEILWGQRFESCLLLEEGAFRVDYSAFHKTFEVPTPPQSAHQRSLQLQATTPDNAC